MGMKNGTMQMIPDDGMKCVWMTSGIISYKLCSLNFLCEECLFDKVMHNGSTVPAHDNADNEQASAENIAGVPVANRLDCALFYHKKHCWVKVLSSCEVLIGIDKIFSSLLCGIRTVVLPKIGESVERGQLFAHILLEKHVVPIIMPVSGTITEVNTSLESRPELVRGGSPDRGWLVAIKAVNLEKDLRTLLFGSKAMEWYRAKEQYLRDELHAAQLDSREQLGMTLHDGGELRQDIAELLTAEQHHRILDEIFG